VAQIRKALRADRFGQVFAAGVRLNRREAVAAVRDRHGTGTRASYAHCDIPCGIYDPEQARIEAESCYKIIGMYQASDDANLKARIIHVKEERAELVKHHLDVLWHDYFKPEHLQQYPDLHETFWKATKQASTVRHSLDLDAARELLSMIDTIDEMWKATGGLEKTRVNGRPC
jgi:nickel superoxide dismutase